MPKTAVDLPTGKAQNGQSKEAVKEKGAELDVGAGEANIGETPQPMTEVGTREGWMDGKSGTFL